MIASCVVLRILGWVGYTATKIEYGHCAAVYQKNERFHSCLVKAELRALAASEIHQAEMVVSAIADSGAGWSYVPGRIASAVGAPRQLTMP